VSIIIDVIGKRHIAVETAEERVAKMDGLF
jgi:hypothetical protein